MRRLLVVSVLCAILGAQAMAQGELSYRRNSLATMLVFHPEDEFGGEIFKAFDSLPIPDKYDDHTIANMRVIDNSRIYGVRRDSGYYRQYPGVRLAEVGYP